MRQQNPKQVIGTGRRVFLGDGGGMWRRRCRNGILHHLTVPDGPRPETQSKAGSRESWFDTLPMPYKGCRETAPFCTHAFEGRMPLPAAAKAAHAVENL